MAEQTVVTFEKVSSSHLRFLRLIGLIPFEGHKLNYIGTQLLSIYFHLMSTLYCTMWMGYGVRMLARKSFEVDFICESLTVYATVCRYVLFYIKREKLVCLVQLCKELWSYLTVDEIVTVKFFERKAYYFRNLLLFNTVGVATVFIISTEFVSRPPITANGTEKKMLPFRFYVDIEHEPMFTIVKVLQAIVVYSMAILIPAMETAGLYLIMMACGYLRSVQNRLLSFTQEQNDTMVLDCKTSKNKSNIDNKNKSDLQEILTSARFHQKIMVYCEDIEQLTRYVFFVAVFATVYNMSIAGLVFLKNDENKFNMAGVFFINLFQFLTYQWSPENLLLESDAIRNAAYFASFQQSKRNAEINRVLCFVMLRAQKSVQLTAGGYVKLSMATFATMLKNSFQFFTVLRSVNT